MFDSGIAKGVDGIQRHCFLYEKFEKDSNDVDSMDGEFFFEKSHEDRRRKVLV